MTIQTRTEQWARDNLRALSEAATPGEWRLGEMENHGASSSDRWKDYSIEVGEGYGRTVLDTINSGVMEIHEEPDEDGSHAWNEQGKRDLSFIVALANAYRSGGLVEAASIPAPQVPEGFVPLVDKLEADSLDAICEVIGSPRLYNEGKSAMRKWFLAKLKAASPPAPGDVGETFATIAEWCEQTFGPITPDRIAHRANEEMAELLADPSRVEEAADVVIVLSRYSKRPAGRALDGWDWGLTWSHIDASTWHLIKPTSKSNGREVAEHVLTSYPELMAELMRVPGERRVGPVVINETTGLPWTESAFRRHFRALATKAGWPADVWNMDSRAGAVSESFEAGADPADVMKTATHKQLSTTMLYNRGGHVQTSRVAALRIAGRETGKKNGS